MISDGDFVAVGLSGGKDSMALVHLLSKLKKYATAKFDLCAISINPGFERVGGSSSLDFQKAKDFCESLDVPLHIVETDIAEVVFEIRNEKNPCSLCANMRRGALATTMNRHGINKLALGHHQDDLIATFLMNLIYGGKIKGLEPVSFLDKKEITVIRPLIYTREKTIIQYCERNDIPVIKSPCPIDKKTARQDVTEIARHLYSINEHAESAIINAVRSLIEKKEES
ncbi:MAG: tRNA lysidine(34) synthetase TilS [Bacillota bacterium]|nr:tRNA lysidine(34) synthetase TilS [Bacillota bacterium]